MFKRTINSIVHRFLMILGFFIYLPVFKKRFKGVKVAGAKLAKELTRLAGSDTRTVNEVAFYQPMFDTITLTVAAINDKISGTVYTNEADLPEWMSTKFMAHCVTETLDRRQKGLGLLYSMAGVNLEVENLQYNHMMFCLELMYKDALAFWIRVNGSTSPMQMGWLLAHVKFVVAHELRHAVQKEEDVELGLRVYYVMALAHTPAFSIMYKMLRHEYDADMAALQYLESLP